MSEDMQSDAIECATQALEKFNIEKDIAAFIKKEVFTRICPMVFCVLQTFTTAVPFRSVFLSSTRSTTQLGIASLEGTLGRT